LTRTVVHLMESSSRLAGGIVTSVRGLASGLQSGDGWRVSIVAPRDDFSEIDRAIWDGLDLRLADGCDRRFSPQMIRSLGSLIGDDVSVVHVHGVWGVGGVAALWRAFRAGDVAPRLVVSPHGMLDSWALAQSRLKKVVARRLWVDRLLRRAGCLHALCDAEAMAIETIAPGSAVCVTPNGVDLRRLVEERRDREASVLFLGRLHRKKGLHPLLEGWAACSARRAGWRLDIAGWDDGGYERDLRAMAASLGLDASVRFLGPVFNETKDALLRRSGVFVLPSYSEGLPMAVLEAWSHGLPVLMTEFCNLPEGFAAGAARCCAPDGASVAAGLDALAMCDRAERAAMGARGRALVEERFAWPRIARRMSEVYDWMLGVGATPEWVRDSGHRSPSTRLLVSTDARSNA
jgi:glycosyltransferase involved in cell wall biosynthesis